MTKYILHGGATSNRSDNNKNFFFTMTENIPDDATILCVYFARPKEDWLMLFEQDKINFSSVSQQKNLRFVLADDTIDTLTEQIKNADTVYLRGGDTDVLKNILGNVQNLNQLFQNKIISGSSAGVYVLSTYYYTNKKDRVEYGLGVLPIKTFCHYTEEKSHALNMLKTYNEDLDIYAIPEEKFFVIEQ